MVIAAGSYPAGRWFESDRRYQMITTALFFKAHCDIQLNKAPWSSGKTSPFHGGIMGSNPVGVTKQVKGEPVSIRRRIRLYRIFQKLKIKKKQSTLCIREYFVFLYAKR